MKFGGMGIPELGIILVVCFVVPIILGIVCMKQAQKKGYSTVGFFLMGFFLGLIGLIIALCVSDRNAPQPVTQVNAVVNPASSRADNYDELLKLKGLLDQGVITQEEFDAKKSQLL